MQHFTILTVPGAGGCSVVLLVRLLARQKDASAGAGAVGPRRRMAAGESGDWRGRLKPRQPPRHGTVVPAGRRRMTRRSTVAATDESTASVVHPLITDTCPLLMAH